LHEFFSFLSHQNPVSKYSHSCVPIGYGQAEQSNIPSKTESSGEERGPLSAQNKRNVVCTAAILGLAFRAAYQALAELGSLENDTVPFTLACGPCTLKHGKGHQCAH